MDGKTGSDIQLYGRLLREAAAYRAHLVSLFLLSVLSAPLALLLPLPLKIAVDRMTGAGGVPGFLQPLLPGDLVRSDTAVLAMAAGLLVLVTALSQLQVLGSTWLRTWTGERLVLGFRAKLFRHVQRLSLAYHDTKGTADSTYRIQYDAPAIQYVAIDGVIPFVTAVLIVLAMLAVSMWIDWQLALIALAVAPLLFYYARIYRLRLRDQWRRVKKLESTSFSVVQEVLSALRIVKAFGQEHREHGRFHRWSSDSARARLRLTLAEGRMGMLVSITTAAGTAAVLFVGGRHVMTGEITPGDLLLVMGYLAQLYGPLTTISRKVATMQSHLASAERAFSLLDETVEVTERPDALPISAARGSVTFEGVGFSYETASPVLQDVCFEAEPGMRVGIAGPTGAGKTTLVNLLTRFYDPTAGRILLDGVDLRDYRLLDLRDQFAMVLQETVLFSTSIAENVAYGRPDAPFEAIAEAARAAGAMGFIEGLPDGFDTLVGERGMRLSGGERQRIALARAFLKDAPILVLDEPTSSVDVKTEAAILENLEELMEGRTTFTIAHRLSTLEGCDMLLELTEGRLERRDNVASLRVAVPTGENA